jgi:hypothetical protein
VRSKTAARRRAKGKPSRFDGEVTEADLAAERARIEKAAEQALAEFNDRYSVVNESGKVWIFEWRQDPVLKREVLDRISHGDFRRLYENRRIDVVSGDKIVRKGIADCGSPIRPAASISAALPSIRPGNPRRST